MFSVALVSCLLLRKSVAFVPTTIWTCRPPERHFVTAESKEIDALNYVDHLLANAKHEFQFLLQDDTDIVQEIHALHAADYATAQSAPLVLEDPSTTSEKPGSTLKFEWLENQVAVESLQPLLTETDLALIRGAAETIWNTKSGEKSSRFTYQYEGNSEAHVSDFAATTPEALEVVNQCLTQTIYPWVRQVFFSDSSKTLIPSQLFVYDALVIRYNATAATTAIAGQPLHRDLGIVSVNIMLNTGFEGGGTYFENQQTTQPLKPRRGPGHALAHYSYERHAGAGTSKGVRDILVLFVSAQDPLPRLINARLKQGRERCGHLQDPLHAILCRAQYQRLAVAIAPEDGEAFQYLGTALLEYSHYLETIRNQLPESTQALLQAIQCLQQAQKLTPRDARVYNNWSIALARLEERKFNVTESSTLVVTSPGQVYSQGLELLLQAEQAGCLVSSDLDSLSLNYGLYLANQDKFREASLVLERTAAKFLSGNDDNRVWKDAHGLWKFCCRQLQ